MSSNSMRRTEFARRDTSGLRQASKRSVAALCAFEDLAGDVAANRMLLGADREYVACSLESDFHIGERAGIETLRNQRRLGVGGIV